MRIAVDVNRYSDYCRNEAEATRVFQSVDVINMPFVVLAELRAGFLRGTKFHENETGLVRFLGSPRVHLLFADDATTHIYASLHTDLARVGTPIPISDLWIAALVIQHDLVLFSRDRHFDRIPRLARC